MVKYKNQYRYLKIYSIYTKYSSLAVCEEISDQIVSCLSEPSYIVVFASPLIVIITVDGSE